MGKCHFNPNWLRKHDVDGHHISEWAKEYSKDQFLCLVCDRIVSVGKKGFQAITQHAESKTHRDRYREKLSPRQLHLSATRSNSDAALVDQPSTSKTVELCTYATSKEKATKAELTWAMKTVASNFSLASCNGVSEVFKAMFPDAFPAEFSLSKKKCSYLITDALEPFFKNFLLKDMNGTYFTLSYDETTNSGNSKELRVGVRYWSDRQNEIVSAHLKTIFIGKATGEEIKEKLLTAIDCSNLPLTNVLMLGSDGPNVNKKVSRLINEEILLARGKKLIDIGSCNIHTIHNAFQKGIAELGENASELIIAVYYFFKGWPSRLEEFAVIQQKVGVAENHFIKHCSTRWLTLEMSAERLLEQWDAVQDYFLKHIPLRKSALTKSNGYKRIINLLKTPAIKAELHFICSSAKIFQRFTGTFQRDEPLIHVLYDELCCLVRTLLGRICPQSVLTRNDIKETMLDASNLLPFKSTVVGEAVGEELKKTDEKNRLVFLCQAQKHYVASCKHILMKTSLNCELIKHFQCLQPEKRAEEQSVHDIASLSKMLPFQSSIEQLTDEWKLLQIENCIEKVDRIDHYWRQVFCLKNATGQLKYPLVTKVIQACMCLSHGNADIERGFSSSARALTADRASMSERMLNAIETVKSGLKYYGGKPELVPIDKQLLTSAHLAHSRYQIYLEEQKRIKVENEAKEKQAIQDKKQEDDARKKLENDRKDIAAYEEQLKKIKEEERSQRNTANKLFFEANERLKKAVKNKNMKEVQLAQAMLQGVQVVQRTEQEQRDEKEHIQNKLEKRKSSLITRFFNKKPKL